MEKYMNFDGSQWANDGIEKQVFTGFDGGSNDTNQTTQLTEEDVVRVSEIYGTALNQSGNLTEDEVIRVSQIYGTALNYDGSSESTQDLWFNHPGLFTRSKKKEKQRVKEYQDKVNANFPNTGSCAVLTDSLGRLNKELDVLYTNSESGNKSQRRVNERETLVRERRKKSVLNGKNSACSGEEANFQRDSQFTQQLFQEGSSPSVGMTPLSMGLGVLALGGIAYGIIKMNKK